MVTLRMIAKTCGVSVATVSKALNGASDINADTARRIRKAADDMGYVPNAAAIALKTSRSYNFGVIFEDGMGHGLTHEFFARIINSFKFKAEELGYDITFISDSLGGRHVGFAEHAQRRNCDGVIIITTETPVSEDVVLLRSADIPIVSIDAHYPDCTCIDSDNAGNMRQLIDYVLSKGHKKVAFIHGDMTSVTQTRLSTFRQVLQEAGIEIPASYIISARYHDPASTSEAVRKLLSLPDPPTCIFFPDDFAYIGGLNEIENNHLSIPKDISAVGFDGIAMSQAMRPRLSTMLQDAEAMGVRAAEELHRAVEQGDSYQPCSVRIPGRLIHGETISRLSD